MSKKLTKQRKVTLIVLGVLLIVGIAIAVVVRQGDVAISKNGIETSATSNGEYLQTKQGGRRGKTVYKARYEFVVDGRTQYVYGEKEYTSTDEIIEGNTVQVKYLADEPHKALVVGEE